MSRDHALYTISFLPVSDTVLKLTENAGIATLGDERYVRVLESVDGEEYSAALYGEYWPAVTEGRSTGGSEGGGKWTRNVNADVEAASYVAMRRAC